MLELAKQSYLRLSSLVEPENRRLQGLVSGNPSVAAAMREADRAFLVNELYRVGSVLYQRMFIDGDPTLRDLMQKVASTDLKRPLRIRVDTGPGIALPWQLLQIPDEVVRDRFWGLQYELYVKPSGLGPAGRLPVDALSDADSNRKMSIMFAHYAGDSADDEVTRLGGLQLGELKKSFPGAVFSVGKSKTEFLNLLASKRTELDLISVFTHGSNGWYVTSADPDSGTGADPLNGERRSVVVTDQIGPRILFRRSEFVTPADVYELKTRFQNLKSVLLERRPLVLLDTCESGASGLRPATSLDFATTMLTLGARGVIVTEAPVPRYFGYLFGKDLHESIAKRVAMPSALLSARKRYFNGNNPLGLLFAYYGNPAAGAGH